LQELPGDQLKDWPHSDRIGCQVPEASHNPSNHLRYGLVLKIGLRKLWVKGTIQDKSSAVLVQGRESTLVQKLGSF
jgi:hypothetical protein